MGAKWLADWCIANAGHAATDVNSLATTIAAAVLTGRSGDELAAELYNLLGDAFLEPIQARTACFLCRGEEMLRLMAALEFLSFLPLSRYRSRNFEGKSMDSKFFVALCAATFGQLRTSRFDVNIHDGADRNHISHRSRDRTLWCVQQALLEQRRPLAANLRRSIAALRGKEERDASRAPSYGQTVRCLCICFSLGAA